MRKLSFGVVLLFLLQLGVSAPERSEGEPSSKESKSKKSFSAAVAASFWSADREIPWGQDGAGADV